MNDISPFLAHITARVPTDDALVLDAGCGPGWFRRLGKGRYLGLDITDAPYGTVPRQVDVVGSVRALPFREASFDLVFVVAALHLFAAPVLGLMEIHRILKPGGRFVCFDYTRRTHERVRDLMYPQHSVTAYNMLDGRIIADMCRMAGFRPVTLARFLPSLSLRLPVPWPFLPVLAPLLDRHAGWWLAEGLKAASAPA